MKKSAVPSSTTLTRRQSGAGFTLIELLVVVSIISLLASMVVSVSANARAKGVIAAGQRMDGHTYQAFGAEAVAIWNLDDGASPAKDDSGNGNNLTLTGVIWTGAGGSFRGNNAAIFSGAGSSGTLVGGALLNGYINSPNGNANVNGSVSFWIKLTDAAITASGQQIMDLQAGNIWAIGAVTTAAASNGAGRFIFFNFPPAYSQPNSNLLAANFVGKWTHIVVSWSSSNTVKIFVNGALAGQSAYTPNNIGTSQLLSVGGGLNGTLDEVRIYSQPIVASEAQQLYAEGAAEHGIALK